MPFTLGELISEHLGTNSDGSPVVSEQTYYSTWRERALQEFTTTRPIQKILRCLQTAAENNLENRLVNQKHIYYSPGETGSSFTLF